MKAASDLYSPVTGEIVEVNQTLIESPQLVNQEPYDAGKARKFYLVSDEVLTRCLIVHYCMKSTCCGGTSSSKIADTNLAG